MHYFQSNIHSTWCLAFESVKNITRFFKIWKQWSCFFSSSVVDVEEISFSLFFFPPIFFWPLAKILVFKARKFTTGKILLSAVLRAQNYCFPMKYILSQTEMVHFNSKLILYQGICKKELKIFWFWSFHVVTKYLSW